MSPDDALPPLSDTPRTRLRRYAERGRTERSALYDVLDAGIVCQFGVVVDGAPRVIPMAYGRDGDVLYVHGSTKNTCLQAAEAGSQVCVTVTLVDGLVLSRSMYNHSLRFRTAMVFGTTRRVTSEEELERGLHRIAEQMVPDRWDHVRPPSRQELGATALLALPMTEASVKIRDGWPHDDEADMHADAWAGVVPLHSTWGPAEPDPHLRPDVALPEHVARLTGLAAFEAQPGHRTAGGSGR